MKNAFFNKLINAGKLLRKVILVVLAVAAICAFIYLMYWLGKSGSYFLFYEDMVQETIREMVKAGSLK